MDIGNRFKLMATVSLNHVFDPQQRILLLRRHGTDWFDALTYALSRG